MEPLPEPLTTVFLAAAGLVLGSFLNVCIYRMPRGESIVHPRSRCPACEKLIRWHDNIPIVSWLVLRGRCAQCSASISIRYPFVEATSAVIVVSLWRVYGASPEFPIAAGFALAMLALFFTDWDHQLLPDLITLSGFAVGMAVAWGNPFLGGEGWARLWAAGVGAALGSGVLWAIGQIYLRLRGVEAMGLGDVKMMAMVGAFTGARGVLFTLFAASLVGAVVGLALVPLRGRTLKDTLPFGCFLAPAAFVALIAGRWIIDRYLSLLGAFP